MNTPTSHSDPNSNSNSNSNEEFEREMANDPIVQLYKRVLKPEPSPAYLDQKILENYRKAFRPPFWKRWFCRENALGDWGFNWPVANALAAGVILGVVIPPVMRQMDQSSSDLTGDWQTIRGQQDTKPVSSETSEEIAKNPKLWLEKIAGLIYEGQIEVAERELVQFKQRYPNYKP